jgi:hypothetical protein
MRRAGWAPPAGRGQAYRAGRDQGTSILLNEFRQ